MERIKPRYRLLTLFLLVAVVTSRMVTVSGWAQDSNPAAASSPPPSRIVVDSSVSRSIAMGLQRTVAELDRLKRLDEIEIAVENTLQRHANDWRVLFQGARIYAELERAGYWVGKRYRRGDLHDRPPKGARRVYSHKRDHVRALQLLDRAIRLSTRDARMDDKAAFYWEAAQILTGEKAFLGLYALTDLSQLPTLEFQEPQVPDREPIPLDERGEPIFFRVPATWAQARNDGERLLWLLSVARKLNPEYEAEAEFIHAKYLLRAYLGVQSITESPKYDPRTKHWEGKESAVLGDVFLESLNELQRDETIAVVGSGELRRISLPEEHNFILKLERMTRQARYASHASLAFEELAETFENRRQYSKAADYWQALIRRTGSASSVRGSDGQVAATWEEDRLHQIVRGWGRFEDVLPIQLGDPLSLGYWYRNGSKAEFTAHRVDVGLLVEDLVSYLQSDPFPIDPSRISVSKLGLNLVREGGERYLKDQVHAWSIDLEAPEDHWEKRIDVPVPLDQPGAYLVEATIDGGHQCSVLVWINDMTILRRQVDNGLFYYVADKKQGTPVGWAKFTFVGFRLALVNQQKEPELDIHGDEIPEALQRQYHVLVKEITKWADARGQLTLDDSVLLPDYRWFLLTTAPNERVAVLGFSDLQPAATELEAKGDGVRAFVTTDRAKYRPGQFCRYRGWVRQRVSSGGGFAVPQGTQVNVLLMSEGGDVVAEANRQLDDHGGFDGELGLPSDLISGGYRLVTRLPDAGGNVSTVAVVVEPEEDPPARLILAEPERQLALGDSWDIRVRSEDANGEPLADMKVGFRVARQVHAPIWEHEGPHAWLFGPEYDAGASPVPWYPGWREWGWDWQRGRDQADGEVVVEDVLETGEDGGISLRIPLTGSTNGLDGAGPAEEDFVFEAWAVGGDDAEMESVVAKMTVAERSMKVFTKVDQSFYTVGNEVGFQAWLRRYDGEPVKGSGELVVYHVDHDREGRLVERGWRQPLHPDAQGEVATRFAVPEVGQYRASYILTDALGVTHEGATVFVVVDESFTGENCQFGDFEILTDRTVYQPGDRAQLRFHTEEPGKTVAVFVRARHGGVGQAEVLRLEQKSTPYEVTVGEDDMPSFIVEAILLNEGEFEVYTKEIAVRPPEPSLELGVTVNQDELSPGAEATFEVSLRDREGRPVAGQVAMSLAPLSVVSDRDSSIKRDFWDDRGRYQPSVEHALKTYFQGFSRPPERVMRPIGIFGAMRLDERTLPQPVELAGEEVGDLVGRDELVKKYASYGSGVESVWMPSIQVGGAGVTEVKCTLPDWEGQWMAKFWAIDSETQVGEAELTLQTRRQWSVSLALQEAVTVGDRMVPRLRVQNRTKEREEVDITIKLPPELSMRESEAADRQVKVTVAPGSWYDWQLPMEAVRAAPKGVDVEIVVGAQGRSELHRRTVSIRDRQEVLSPVWNGTLEPLKQRSNADGQFAFSAALPESFDVEDSSLTISVAKGAFQQVASVFPENGWNLAVRLAVADEVVPMVSFATPVLALGHYLRTLDAESQERLRGTNWEWALKDDQALSDVAGTLLERLASSQRAEGGWGQALDAPSSDLLATLSVLESLLVIKGTGLDESRFEFAEKALNWTRLQQKARSVVLSNGQPPQVVANDLDAYTYLVLLQHEMDLPLMRDFLFRDWKALSALGKVLLAQALRFRGDIDDSNIIRFALGEMLAKDARTGGTRLQSRGKATWSAWSGSPVELQARYADFLYEVKGDAPVTRSVVEQLSQMRSELAYWGSDRDTCRARLALVGYLRLLEAAPASAGESELRLSVDDREVISVKPTVTGGELVLTGTQLAEWLRPMPSGEEVLSEESDPVQALVSESKLQITGPAGALVHVSGKLVRRPLLIAAADAEAFSVERRFGKRAPAGDRQWVSPGEEVRLGEVLDVAVTMKAEHALYEMAYRDPLPAGFALEGALPEGALLRDGAIHLHLDTLEKEQEMVYQLKAVQSGRYHALPAELGSTFQRAQRARTEEMVFVVR